ncbi:dihydropyrimidinase isoform X3 [Chrysoperla carnea]|uniref:dihydropyrimidinase isoform X3 n=1 Tax=Chrysoperla carnea TaxID=189513 RepID=UPI001D07345F|nr:dihydropyrimidinase isoform X3 [Chrysoperla carnea]
MTTTSHVKKVPIHLQSAQNRLLIKNGRIVNEDGIAEGDIYIEEGVIKQLGRNLIIPGGTRVIDARGKLIMPGGIDPHTHFEMEFMGSVTADDFYQGTKAAIAGGTTTIIDFVMPRSDETLLEAYMRYREKADPKVCCDYALHVCVTSWGERQKNEIKELTAKHGINSYKLFMAYNFALRDSEIYQLMDTCKSIGALTMVHAENGDVITENTKKLLAKGVTGPHGHELSRNEEVEAEAVNRACVIAKQVESPLYVVHVMSQSAAQALNQFKINNSELKIIGETLAAALGTDGSHYYHADWYHAARHILSPPLRPNKETPNILMHYLAEDKLHLTGSDNCTFTAEQKAAGKNDFSKIPNGVNGVEDRLYVVWEKGVVNGIMDPSRFVAITSTNAAKLFNLYPQKGCIAVGSDADIIVWDPNQTKTISAKTHHHAIDFNIFEGLVCHGAPEYVIVNGRVCVDEGELKAVQGYGRFLPTLPFAPYVYGTDDDIAAVEKKRLHSYENELTLDHLNINNGNGPNAQEEVIYNMPTLPNSSVSTPIGKAPRQEGQRNLQSSSFSISKDPDADDRRSCIRVKNPPGGKSSGGFW